MKPITPLLLRSPLWTPAKINPKIWVDDDSSITDVSGFASDIANRGSLGNSFSQSTSTLRPAINASGIGGRRTLDFDGVSGANGDRMASTAFGTLFRNVGVGWIFAVSDKIAADGVDTARTFASWSEVSSTGLRAGLLAGRSAAGLKNTPSMSCKRLDASAEAPLSSVSGERSDPIMMLGYFDWSANLQTLYIDGASNSSTSIAASGGNTSDTDSALAEIGARVGSTAANADVRLAALVASSGSLSSGDIDRIFGWAAHRWGLTANLPGGHPYKNNAPTA